jgi:hypothetical protein
MKKYDYQSTFIEYNSQREMDAKLTLMGEEGWEIVKIQVDIFLSVKQIGAICFVIFKKPKDDHNQKMSQLFNRFRGLIGKL